MRYRIVVDDIPRLPRGSIRDMTRQVVSAVSDQIGREPHEWSIPEDWGTHYSERPEVEPVEIPDNRQPLPPSSVPALEALKEAVEKARSARDEATAHLARIDVEIKRMRTQLRFIGATGEEITQIRELNVQRADAVEDMAAREGEWAAATRRLELAETREAEPEADYHQLRQLLLKLLQYEGLLAIIDESPGYLGKARFLHGLEAERILLEFVTAIQEATGLEKITLGVLKGREDTAELLTWGETTVTEYFSHHEKFEEILPVGPLEKT